MQMIGPCLFFDGTLVATDIHLGLEDQHEGSMGLVASSKRVIAELEASIARAERSAPVERIVLAGDVLDDFSLRRLQSRIEITRLLRGLGRSRELILIRGNHDTMLETLHLDASIRESYVQGSVLVTHGDRELRVVADRATLREADTLIIGHDHPVLALSDGLRLERFKCFVRIPVQETPYGPKEVYVLPSAHPDILGTDVTPRFRSPVVVGDHPEAEVFVVSEPVRFFGTIGDLVTR